MRLTSLSLFRYGSFEDRRISFDPEPGVINVLMAPNGGGKSVLRSAFCDLLFGIGGQSPMGFRFGYPGMRIMADAILPSGQAFRFGRRKGQGNTLIKADGSAMEAASINSVLGGIGRPLLEQLFALDTAMLRAGGKDLLASNGQFGAALVSGAGGGQNLRALSKKLLEERDALAPVRRSAQRPFYQAIDTFAEARKLIAAATLRPEAWHKQEQQKTAAEQRRAEHNRIAEALSAEIALLERIRRVRPWLVAHDIAAAWLADHPDAPVLDADLADRLAYARSEIVLAKERLRLEREAAVQLAEQVTRISVDEALLADGADIDRLVEAAGAARKAFGDLPLVSAQADSRADVLTVRLRELGAALPVERAVEAVPGRAVINRVRRLAQAYPARQEAAHNAPLLLAERKREMDAVGTRLAALGAVGDLSDLAMLVKEIRADGEPARRVREASLKRAEAAGQAAAALARVPGWTDDAAALLTLAPLPPDSYERRFEAVTIRAGQAATALDAVRVAREQRDAAKSALLAITRSGPLPSEAELSRARQRRDKGWRLIYRRAFTPDIPSALEDEAFAGSVSLPIAYERAVSVADDIADHRMRHATEIAQAEAAQSALADAERRVLDAETTHRQAEEARSASLRAWYALCGIMPLGDAPEYRDVRAFLAARDAVITANQALRAAEAVEATLSASHAGWAERLATMLGEAVGRPVADLLGLAEKRLSDAEKTERARAGLVAERDAAAKAVALAEAAARDAGSALDNWRKDWDSAIVDLGRSAGEDPSVTEDVLAVYADLEQAQKDWAGLMERVRGMRTEVALFERDALQLAVRVAPDLPANDPFVLVAALRLRLQAAREAAKQRDLLRKQAEAARHSVSQAERRLNDSEAALRAIMLLIGAETVEAAEARLLLAAERARHAANLDAADMELVKAGDGRSLDALRSEAAQVPPDDVQPKIEGAARQRQEALSIAQDAAALASALEQQMKQAADATGAADAAADQQAAVATMGRVLEDALTYHIAAAMLDHALSAVERDSEPDLLRRISALFERLTNGSYERVLTEIGDDGSADLVLMQRADLLDKRQTVFDLSEGTRDQLYLALRLAAIEQHAAAAPPLPFIGDDILQTFDDDRALAALKVLREDISQTVQVILLTHHRHVLDLAAALPAGSVHVCQIGAASEVG